MIESRMGYRALQVQREGARRVQEKKGRNEPRDPAARGRRQMRRLKYSPTAHEAGSFQPLRPHSV